MNTRHFKYAAVGSLILSIVVAAMLGRSLFRKDHVGVVAVHWTASATSAGGVLRFGYGTSPISASREGWSLSSEPVTNADVMLNQFGHQEDTFILTKGGTVQILQWWFPYWLAMLTAAIIPAAFVVARRVRNNRRATGTCLSCGYDLRATPKQCPECGTLTKSNRPGSE
jgi:hypothetical protein